MRKNNVNIVHVVINEYAPMLNDLIILLGDKLRRAGINVTNSVNQLDKDSINILVGHILFLPEERYKRLSDLRDHGYVYIVFQLDVLDERSQYSPYFKNYLKFIATAHQVWDYSQANMNYLIRRGHTNVQHIPIGYSASLERVNHENKVKDVDIFFYGMLTERRLKILNKFHDRGVRIEVGFKVFGSARDEMIARSRIILNMHQSDTPHLEEVRIAFLLCNRCFVLSETADHDPYLGGVVFCDYENLVEDGIHYLQNNMQAEIARVIDCGYSAIKNIPMAKCIQSALEKLYRPNGVFIAAEVEGASYC